ncbi:MAG TPA: YqaE/Pmp3 family membrane protein [Chitinophagaceae bacterium]|nr:YqaE/Pmp3 family membrane protein [Chitinophagaceae bacterium]
MKKIIFLLLTFLNLYAVPAFSSPVTNISENKIVSLPIEPTPAAVKNALEEFKHLSKKEKRERINKVKAEIKIYKASLTKTEKTTPNKFWLTIIAILLPPLAIYLYEGEIRKCFWISLLLTLLFWLPGIIYTLIIINQH